MKKLINIIVPSIVLLSLINTSCKKDNKIEEEKEKHYEISLESVDSIVQLETSVNAAYLDVLGAVMRAGAFLDTTLKTAQHDVRGNIKKLNAYNTSYASSSDIEKDVDEELRGDMKLLEIDGPGFPYFVQIDWTDKNQLAKDGLSRRGGMQIKFFEGYWGTKGARAEVTFLLKKDGKVLRQNFFLNNHAINGKVSIYNEGDNNYKMSIEYGIVANIEPDSLYSKRDSSVLNLKLTEGYGTQKTEDDVWQMSGDVHGVSYWGQEYSLTISENMLTKHSSKLFPNKGLVSFDIKGMKFNVDYNTENAAYNDTATLFFYDKKEKIVLNDYKHK